jgi:hypothetical protein
MVAIPTGMSDRSRAEDGCPEEPRDFGRVEGITDRWVETTVRLETV